MWNSSSWIRKNSIIAQTRLRLQPTTKSALIGSCLYSTASNVTPFIPTNSIILTDVKTTHPINERQFYLFMQLFSHLQWWSKSLTHLLQVLQCFDAMSTKLSQSSQYKYLPPLLFTCEIGNFILGSEGSKQVQWSQEMSNASKTRKQARTRGSRVNLAARMEKRTMSARESVQARTWNRLGVFVKPLLVMILLTSNHRPFNLTLIRNRRFNQSVTFQNRVRSTCYISTLKRKNKLVHPHSALQSSFKPYVQSLKPRFEQDGVRVAQKTGRSRQRSKREGRIYSGRVPRPADQSFISGWRTIN